MGAQAHRGADEQRRRQGREFRSAAWAAFRPTSTIDRDTAMRLGLTLERDRQHALRRLRPAPGLDHLQRAQPVSRRHGGRAAILAGSADAEPDLCLDLGRQSDRRAADRTSRPAITRPRPEPRARRRRSRRIRRAISRPTRLRRAATASASTGAAVSTSVETMVPLSAFAKFAPGHTPLSVNHQGQFAATTISFNLAPGRVAERSQDRDRQRHSAHRHAVDRARRLRRHRGDLPAVAIEHAAPVRRRRW